MGELRDKLVKRRKTPVKRGETPEKSEEPERGVAAMERTKAGEVVA